MQFFALLLGKNWSLLYSAIRIFLVGFASSNSSNALGWLHGFASRHSQLADSLRSLNGGQRREPASGGGRGTGAGRRVRVGQKRDRACDSGAAGTGGPG